MPFNVGLKHTCIVSVTETDLLFKDLKLTSVILGSKSDLYLGSETELLSAFRSD